MTGTPFVKFSVFAFLLVAATTAAAAPPQALHNKTVVLAWNEYRVQRCDDGQTDRSNTGSTLQVYISDAGRLFSRLSRASGNTPTPTPQAAASAPARVQAHSFPASLASSS